jgi:hypothetical protein
MTAKPHPRFSMYGGAMQGSASVASYSNDTAASVTMVDSDEQLCLSARLQTKCQAARPKGFGLCSWRLKVVGGARYVSVYAG